MKVISATLCVAAIFAIVSYAFSQEELNRRGRRVGKALDYQLVEQTRWQGLIDEVILHDAGNISSAKPHSLVARKKLDNRVVDERIDFFDASGSLAYSKDLADNQYVDVRSKDGTHVLIQTIVRKVTKSEPGLNKLELLDAVGKLLWTKEEEYYWEGESVDYYLANDGSSVRVQNMSGILTFYDREGQIVNEVRIFPTSAWSRGRFLRCDFSDDGRYLAVNASDDVGESFPDTTAILLFDNQGSELWRYHTDEEDAQIIKISPTNKVIIATSSTFEHGDFTSRSTYLLDFGGALIQTFPMLANDFYFSTDGKYCAIVHNARYSMAVYDIVKKERLLNYSPFVKIHAVDFSETRKLIGMVTVKEILVYHYNGVPAWSTALGSEDNERRRARHIGLRFSDDGNEFQVSLSSGLYGYQLVE